MEHRPDTIADKQQKRITTGIVAHVDAGKTTLSESILYSAGCIRKRGRVDTKDAFLDTYELERSRGITIFSKQARFSWEDMQITLVDTPGHVDFSAEMERTLRVLDYAVLVISGADGVQGHTLTLWKLLERYDVPVFLFVNKMDQPGTDREKLMTELKSRLDCSCVDFTDLMSQQSLEDIASCDEETMETYFETGGIRDGQIRKLIWERRLFPCFFGSALKMTGVEAFLRGFARYTLAKAYPDEFGARVYKIARDTQGNRLTHLKITGGFLKAKTALAFSRPDVEQKQAAREEKVDQIRVYHGEKFELLQEARAGEICAVTGLTGTYPGQGLGFESEADVPVLKPVLSRQVLLPDGSDAGMMLPKLRMLEEELPELHIVWDERLQEIQAQVMGEVQTEVLSSLIEERFGVPVCFGPAHIVYRETITAPVEGVGHFEPLRHYAEVHLLMEPLPSGSGLIFSADCSEDLLDKNWQRLILQHLGEKTYRGVLTGSAITDMKITVVAGRAHPKHTEGGDFREATYRAVRQGLMEAESRLLEPFYDFRLEIPEQSVGRAMTDIEKMCGHCEPPYTEGENCILLGYAPVATMQDYGQEVSAYTRGFGRLSVSLRGYEPCHNAEEVVAASGYDPEADPLHSPDSVFCSHGSGIIVPWDQVKDQMHVASPLAQKVSSDTQPGTAPPRPAKSFEEQWLGTDEIDEILEKTYHANRGKRPASGKGVRRLSRSGAVEPVQRSFRREEPKEEYLLVDGYNIIFAWDDLNELARENMDAARGKLLDELCNYQGMHGMHLMVVFDAYRVTGHQTEILDYHNICVVYTKEAETADQYIEKFAHENAKNYRVTVATSDGLEQIIIRGEGCRLLSARDLKEEMEQVRQMLRLHYTEKGTPRGSGEFRNAVESAVSTAKEEHNQTNT
ncbi:MAG: TetM/TetW/TetO/TetS family tetracycline resistance ribosomal protection protein [Clostridiales bacterium]|nr:TetM/TetW/TetO/TetS family tetracycline resistance ribosomal protection protein [Clostridiales bacterium]